MYTPGYEEENKTKPAITLRIEEDDPGLTAEQGALGLLEGENLVLPGFLRSRILTISCKR